MFAMLFGQLFLVDSCFVLFFVLLFPGFSCSLFCLISCLPYPSL